MALRKAPSAAEGYSATSSASPVPAPHKNWPVLHRRATLATCFPASTLFSKTGWKPFLLRDSLCDLRALAFRYDPNPLSSSLHSLPPFAPPSGGPRPVFRFRCARPVLAEHREAPPPALLGRSLSWRTTCRWGGAGLGPCRCCAEARRPSRWRRGGTMSSRGSW